MKLFCTNAFTGEDVDIVTKRMRLVVDTLDKSGHKAYCPIFDHHKIGLQAKNDTKAIFDYAFENITKSDGMVAIVTSGKKSEGQLMEAGAMLVQKKPLYLFINISASEAPSHLPKLSDKTFMWSSEDELMKLLAKI